MPDADDLKSRIDGGEFDYLALLHALREYARPRGRITDLLRRGEIVRVKKGIYVFGEGPGARPFSLEVLANLITMQKSKINITMDPDLIEYAKLYASTQSTTVSEVFTQFVLNLKRVHEDDPMQVVLADPGFRDSLLATMAKIQSGEAKWSGYDEVFG